MINETVPIQHTNPQFISRLSLQQQQQLASYIADIIITPLENTRISVITQKFHTIQSQIVQVIEQRVTMECSLEIQSIKEKNFETICRLYDAVKERDKVIDELGKKVQELDLKYLMKVTELQEIRVGYVRVTQQLQEQKRMNFKGSGDQANDISQIEKEIISLKETFRNFFGPNHQPNLDQLKLPHSQNDLTIKSIEPQLHQSHNQVNLSQQLRKQVSLLKSHLNLRLQLLQESNQTSDKYQCTQQQLIQRLIDELMRQKQINTNQFTHSSQRYLSRELVEETEATQKAYQRSRNDLDDILEMELVRIKEQLEKYQQMVKHKQTELQRYIRKIKDLEQLVKEGEIVSQKYKMQLDKITTQHEKQLQTNLQSLKQLKLLNESHLQQLQLKHIQQLQHKQTHIISLSQKIQHLQAQLSQTRESLLTTQSVQLIKAKEEIERLKEANQSLANEKILIKTLNKKLNKEANETNEEKKKVIIERDKSVVERDRAIEEIKKVKEEMSKMNEQISKMNQEISKLKEQLLSKNAIIQSKDNQIKEITFHLTIKQNALTELQNHLSQVQSKLLSTEESLIQQISQAQQNLHQLTQQYQTKQIQMNQMNQTLKQLEKINQVHQETINSYQQEIKLNKEQTASLQHEIKKLQLTVTQKDRQVQMLTHFAPTGNATKREDDQQNVENTQENYQNVEVIKDTQEQNQTKSNQIFQEKQLNLSLRETRIKELLQSLRTAQQQLDQKQFQLLEKESSYQKQFKIKEASLSFRYKELTQKQQQLTKKLEEYQINFNSTRQMFINEGQLLEHRQIEIEKKLTQLNQKQLQIDQSFAELAQHKQKLEQQKLTLQQIRQSIEQSRQQPLSPPPSPFQHPLESPPESPSPFKLEKSSKIISNTVSESVKGKLSFEGGMNNLKIHQIQIDQEIEGLEKVDQVCRVIADDWMKSEQEKWNLLHYQLDLLAQFVLNAEI